MVFVFVSLTGSIFCELLFTLGKPLDSCVLPGLIISGGGPFQWNEVGHHLLEGGPELLDRVSLMQQASTDVAKYMKCSYIDNMSAFCHGWIVPPHRVVVGWADLDESLSQQNGQPCCKGFTLEPMPLNISFI